MGKQEVKDYFDKFIFGFIFSDIEREIALAKSGLEIPGASRTYTGGGNFLCALGLLCYTEFMGGLKLGSFSRKIRDEARFNAFFNLMGPDYEAFKQEVNVYGVFRCGMAHEYFIKGNCVISMLSGKVNMGVTIDGDKPGINVAPSALIGPVQYGIGSLDTGKYFFVVEQYFKDFKDTCHKVYDEIINHPDPSIPSPR